VRSVRADSRKRKIRRTGRHSAPSQINKAAKQARKAVPAVAVIGALAATPQVRDFALGTPAGSAGHQAMAQLSYSDEVADPPADNPVWFKNGGEPRGRAAVRGARQAADQQARKQSRHSGSDSGPRQSGGQPGQSGGPAGLSGSQPGGSGSQPGGSGSQPGGSGSQPGQSSKSGSPPAGATLSCTGTAGMLPANYAAIVSFLTAHGYTGLAAAGIAGNIYQESGGNPESVGSGGGGLIGWTPLPPGFVTGNPAADLQTQLAAILTYNAQWSQYIPALNAATTAPDAAYIYMSDFERPGIPAAANREAAASAVAAACGL
jgi:Phage tail lysozyme